MAVRDLAGRVAVEETAAELADLADACLEAALAVAAGESGYDPPPMRLAVLGMGKLGGTELNYVSDIDVLFCHEPVAGAEPEAAARAAERVARGVMRGLSAVTSEGTCFEVDANLRPEGRNGPLSRTLGSYLAYWDRWAQPWELQALIKVRPVAGDAELAERFRAEAEARVYPERLDPETVPAVRRMKARVETSAKARAGGDRQVKLGPGGLRDIEFAVQLLQLVHGRHDPALRSGSTLVALDRLTAAGFVGRADAAQLAEAYRFLRLVEHRLQLASERRTHTIPAGEEARRWLARTLGYRDGPEAGALERFEADRRRHAGAVRGLHEKLFYRPLLEAFGAVPAGLDPEGASERLAALGFANPDRAMASLRALTSGLSRRATLMRAMLPVMLPWLAEAPDPDGGLAALRVLAEALGDRAAFYGMVRDNPAAAELLCTVLGTSRLLGDLLARHPELLTAMADQHRVAAVRGPAELVASANAIVARHDETAAAWDGLRRFKRRELVRVAVRDLTGDLPVERVGAELAALAQACLEAGLAVAMREAGEGPPPVRVAVLGMGKLGGTELSYTSDLDVLFCHEPVAGADPETANRAADRVVRELLRGLSAVTPEGTCFKVDPNLRPEGRNGPLSRTLGSYLAYWDRWAQPWERQALIKVRPVAGDAELAGRFCAEAEARVYTDPLDPATVAEVRRMKARVESERLPAGADPKLHLKLGPGGLADVEWTAQLLQLRVGGGQPAVRVQPHPGRPGRPGRGRRPRPRPGGLAGRRLPALPAHPQPRLPGRGPPRRLPSPPTRSPWNAWPGPWANPAASASWRTTAAPPAAPAAWSTPASGTTPLEHARPATPLLVCVGDLMVDVAVEAPALARGGDVAGAVRLGPGGSAANVAAWAAAAGGAGAAGGRAGRRPGRAAAGRRPGRAGDRAAPGRGRWPGPAGRCWW